MEDRPKSKISSLNMHKIRMLFSHNAWLFLDALHKSGTNDSHLLQQKLFPEFQKCIRSTPAVIIAKHQEHHFRLKGPPV